MFAMVIKRCLGTLPLLLLITLFTFALMKAVPGDPVDVLLGSAERDLAPQQVTLLRQEMGLDQPLYKQYLGWLSGWWGKGELGRSYRDGRPAASQRRTWSSPMFEVEESSAPTRFGSSGKVTHSAG